MTGPISRLLLFVTVAVIAAAQPPGASLSVPVLGYVFDNNAKAIRSVSGVPGAASLGDLVPLNTSIDSAFVDSWREMAVANTKQGTVVLIRWSAAPQAANLPTSLGRVTEVAFAPSGDQAAISDGTGVEVWTGLSSASPVNSAAFSPDGGVNALAMNANGLVVVATAKGAIAVLGSPTRAVATGEDWSGVAFLPNGADVLAVDAGSGNLVLIQDVQNAAATSVLASFDSEPGAIAVAQDGTAAALAGAGTITLVSLAGGATASISCHCTAQALDPLEGNLVMHLTDSQSGSELLVDADSVVPRVLTLLSVNGGSAQ